MGAVGPGVGRSQGCPSVQAWGCWRLFQCGVGGGIWGRMGYIFARAMPLCRETQGRRQPQRVGYRAGAGPWGISYGLGIIGPDVGPHNMQVVLGVALDRHWRGFKREK